MARPCTTPDGWRDVFLATLTTTGSVTQAAAAARVSLPLAYHYRKNEASFRAAWIAARGKGITPRIRLVPPPMLFGDRPPLPMPRRVSFDTTAEAIRAAALAGALEPNEVQDLLARERRRATTILEDVAYIERRIKRMAS